MDPFFSAAALHFDDVFARYGTPCVVLNLVKQHEKTPRESILLKEFTQAIEYLNQFLPASKQIEHIAWDMSNAAKSRDQDVIRTLEQIAENLLNTTSFFCAAKNPGSEGEAGLRLQNGIGRTNCIDCIDRTNAAQFIIGKRALGYQLNAIGVIENNVVDFDSDAVNLLTEMYHDHGDTIALQYGGSHLVNTMETYRKINQWTSHSRDMIESVRRFYNNSFVDAQRQEAINLFLGNYIYDKDSTILWDMSNDHFLHYTPPDQIRIPRRSYRQWWTPENLANTKATHLQQQPYEFWLEYYRPRTLSSLRRIFAFTMNSTLRYIPLKTNDGTQFDQSPFKARELERSPEKETTKTKGHLSLHRWLTPQEHPVLQRAKHETDASDEKVREKRQENIGHHETEALVASLMALDVSARVEAEYRRYLNYIDVPYTAHLDRTSVEKEIMVHQKDVEIYQDFTGGLGREEDGAELYKRYATCI